MSVELLQFGSPMTNLAFESQLLINIIATIKL